MHTRDNSLGKVNIITSCHFFIVSNVGIYKSKGGKLLSQYIVLIKSYIFAEIVLNKLSLSYSVYLTILRIILIL